MKDALKQRLVGAVVLAAIGVIFLPGFFKEQQGHQVDTRTQIPAEPSSPQVTFETPQQPAEISPAPEPETMFLPPEPEPKAEVEEASASVASADSNLVDTTVDTTDEVPELPLGADGIPEAWVVQVASLSNKEAASKLRDELQADGHKAYVRTVTTANGSVTRVFIGPKLDKAEALKVKAEVDKRLKVNAMVLRFKP
ncbi:MAG TPA: SPOR domain-containing protein [Cellvibrio sp.]|nr:SPOR domain-containing protein [Cellvibrio sp.]